MSTLFDIPQPPPSKTIRGPFQVLIYPNITYSKNLEADSFIVLITALLKRLTTQRTDLAFTILVPKRLEMLDMPGVHQIVYPLPTYPNTMRCHFNANAFLNTLNWKRRSWDIIWSHLPEHTAQIRNVIYNSTNERPLIIGYSHWIELPQNTAYTETMIHANLAGMLAMEWCGVNSQWVKDRIIERAQELLHPDLAKQLERKIRVRYLGHDIEPSVGKDIHIHPRLFIWNHRLATYTGYPQALKALDRLWEDRRDFRVWFTLGHVDRPYAATPPHMDPLNYRPAYHDVLRQGAWGIARGGYAPWSVAVTEGLELGLPYIAPRDGMYPEVLGDDWPLLHRPGDTRDMARALNDALVMEADGTATLLDDKAHEIGNTFNWRTRIAPFATDLDEAVGLTRPTTPPTPTYARFRTLADKGLDKHQIMREMNWGVRIPYSPYRWRWLAEQQT